MKSKKGTYAADTAPFYAMFAIVTSVLFIIFVFIVNSYSVSEVEIPKGINEYISQQRFIRSPDCFAYEDISGRTYPSVMDWTKFNQKRIEECYASYGEEKLPAFSLTLSYAGKEKTIYTDNWNTQAGPEKREPPKNVLVQFGTTRHEGTLTIEIQNV